MDIGVRPPPRSRHFSRAHPPFHNNQSHTMRGTSDARCSYPRTTATRYCRGTDSRTEEGRDPSQGRSKHGLRHRPANPTRRKDRGRSTGGCFRTRDCRNDRCHGRRSDRLRHWRLGSDSSSRHLRNLLLLPSRSSSSSVRTPSPSGTTSTAA